VFVPGKPFQPSLIFVGEAREGPTLVWSTNTSLLRKSVNYGRKEFYSTDPRIIWLCKKEEKGTERERERERDMTFQPSLMFAS
jgi:hypothetical protein